MDYYHITTVLEDSDDNENDESKNDEQEICKDPHKVLNTCLSQNTVEDIMKEYNKNTVNQSNDKNEAPEVCPGPGPGQDPGGVVLRRKPQRSSSYSHRASQRFSRLLEGVTSITSLVSLSSYTKEDTEAPASLPNTPAQDVEEDGGPASLPYWVEANQNIYKVSKKAC